MIRETVQKILAREIARLDALSNKSGLELGDVRILDLLIKAEKSFTSPPETPPADESSPDKAPIETLLDGITNTETFNIP